MWYAIYEKLTGKLYSTGTILTKTLDPKYAVLELGENFDFTDKVWDEANKQFIPDKRFQDILNAVSTLPGIDKLTASEKTSLKNYIEKIMKGEIIW